MRKNIKISEEILEQSIYQRMSHHYDNLLVCSQVIQTNIIL